MRSPAPIASLLFLDGRGVAEGDGAGEGLAAREEQAAYFAYANRTVQGLGVSFAGEELGLSPGNSDDPDNWSHG